MKNSINRRDLGLNKLLWVLATILAGISSGNSQTPIITGGLTAPPAYTSVDIAPAQRIGHTLALAEV
jgi:hypothetical protein